MNDTVILAKLEKAGKAQKGSNTKGELVTGFVCLLETYNGKRKKMITVTSPEMPEYQAYGMINFASINFEYADTPEDDDWDEDSDYDPDWYKRQ